MNLAMFTALQAEINEVHNTANSKEVNNAGQRQRLLQFPAISCQGTGCFGAGPKMPKFRW